MKPACIDDILEAFELRGGQIYGEDVTQRQHALQAANLAAEDGAAESLIAAALLHDFGHLLEPEGERPTRDSGHEAVGAALLNRLFKPEVTGPIALHVAAKRYLCAIEPGYLADLSAASCHSLALQGGPFSKTEAARFVTRPHSAAAIRLRRYDDLAKVVGAPTPDLASYVAMLSRLSR